MFISPHRVVTLSTRHAFRGGPQRVKLKMCCIRSSCESDRFTASDVDVSYVFVSHFLRFVHRQRKTELYALCITLCLSSACSKSGLFISLHRNFVISTFMLSEDHQSVSSRQYQVTQQSVLANQHQFQPYEIPFLALCPRSSSHIYLAITSSMSRLSS